jgi:hypothetical protein
MNIEPLNTDSLNYNTCRFRSEDLITQHIKRCSCRGGDYTISGYLCYEKDIFDVKPEICKDCASYKTK